MRIHCCFSFHFLYFFIHPRILDRNFTLLIRTCDEYFTWTNFYLNNVKYFAVDRGYRFKIEFCMSHYQWCIGKLHKNYIYKWFLEIYSNARSKYVWCMVNVYKCFCYRWVIDRISSDSTSVGEFCCDFFPSKKFVRAI